MAGLQARECGTVKVNSISDLLGALAVPHSLARNPAIGHGVKYRCVQRARSILPRFALDFALQFRDMDCFSSQKKVLRSLTMTAAFYT